ncbi:DNA-binding HxlR family transcriptional regulator [Geodermatophilus bullaregiensis]|uniref:winged helix-turn-helix transcriptional regulator n=1 Tax=Geodermatophilus bullaregiensis TaxID=1564160 RepID=UPI001958AB4D|nr:helix-turn-helix domain-containing protein [Geodermatophilus bullaregiensis]MBM7808827.1 DNA-binding HxlR family transcriptional regulator [Geodermatophilus bullaregiensis]
MTADTRPAEEFDRARCSVGGTLAVVGEKWSLLVLREAFLGVRRFADLQRALGAPRAVLTDRLASLVASGLLVRVPYRPEGERQRHEYRLTDKGRDLYPALVALMQWGDRWLTDDGAAPLELAHRDCGEPVSLALRCAAGHDVAGPREVRATPAGRAAGTGATPPG